MERFSKTQIDKLGQRLRSQSYDESDLRLLDEYRRTFGPAYDRVVETVQRISAVPVSGRPAKSTSSIVEKLNRESIRLSQVQDVAGCRMVVEDIPEQDLAASAIVKAFAHVVLSDRRLKPSHGYRAVHLIVRMTEKPIEVQIRTVLQHLWAEISEKCADVFDPSIKYGGGPPDVRKILNILSELAGGIEEAESELVHVGASDGEFAQQLREVRNEYVANLQSLLKELDELDSHA